MAPLRHKQGEREVLVISFPKRIGIVAMFILAIILMGQEDWFFPWASLVGFFLFMFLVAASIQVYLKTAPGKRMFDQARPNRKRG